MIYCLDGKDCPPGKNQFTRCEELAVCQRIYSTDIKPGGKKLALNDGRPAGFHVMVRKGEWETE